MTTQLTVRIPDDLAAFVDEEVRAGGAASRAAMVATALRRERRHRRAQLDAAIYARTEPDPDLDAATAHLAHRPLDLD